MRGRKFLEKVKGKVGEATRRGGNPSPRGSAGGHAIEMRTQGRSKPGPKRRKERRLEWEVSEGGGGAPPLAALR